MKRKNKDWVIALEEGCPKGLLNLLHLELNKEGVPVFWDDYDCSFAATDYLIDNTFNTCETDPVKSMINSSRTKRFVIPSQWKEAKEYILEEEYKLPDTGWVKCEEVIINRTGKDSGYGIDRWGEWVNDGPWSFICNPESWQIATHEEVKEALIKQAERIGYKVGDRIKVPWCDATRVIEDDDNCDLFEYDGDNLIYCKNELLMSDGQWAEIIKEEPKELVIDCKNAEHCEIDRKLIFHNYLSLNTEFYLSHKDSETIKGIIKKENYEIIIREKS